MEPLLAPLLASPALKDYNGCMTTKEVIRKLLDRLPDDASIEDVQYQIYVLQKIQAGGADLKAGRVKRHDEVMKDLARVFQQSGLGLRAEVGTRVMMTP